ncbi:MAG: type III pantothenate kinase [Alphaproteobacteria bacterium]
MLLAIDVGNTNTVFAIFSEDTLMHSWRCTTERSRSADQYAVFLNQMFELVKIQLDDIDDVIISSVVPDTHFNLDRLCANYIKKKALFVNADNAEIHVDLDQPNEIGADRLVNAAAVIAHYQTPAVVVDLGTATTFDVIDEGNIYRGGVIAPGVRLSMGALTNRAAKLPQITIEKPEKTIGKSTLAAMQSGMYWGYIGLIETILERITEELGKTPTIIATGGLAPLYAQSTDSIDVVDENLIFKGLLEIYKKETAKNNI